MNGSTLTLSLVGALAVGAALGRRGSRATDPTSSPAFRRWFGESKVVDEAGRPRVVYHANVFIPDEAAGLTTFSKEKQRFGKAGFGFYFADQAGANLFAEYGERYQSHYSVDGHPNRPNITPAYLKMENPLVVDHVDDLKPYLDHGQKFGVARGVRGNLSPDAKLHLQRLGYDGIITRETTAAKVHKTQGLKILDRNDPKAKSFPVYVVFDPTQIKSATGNRGTFDPSDPRISFNRGVR